MRSCAAQRGWAGGGSASAALLSREGTRRHVVTTRPVSLQNSRVSQRSRAGSCARAKDALASTGLDDGADPDRARFGAVRDHPDPEPLSTEEDLRLPPTPRGAVDAGTVARAPDRSEGGSRGQLLLRAERRRSKAHFAGTSDRAAYLHAERNSRARLRARERQRPSELRDGTPWNYLPKSEPRRPRGWLLPRAVAGQRVRSARSERSRRKAGGWAQRRETPCRGDLDRGGWLGEPIHHFSNFRSGG